MQGANVQLRSRLQEMAADALEMEDELHQQRQLNEHLISQHPEIKTAVEMALQKEQATHDIRNEKVLQLLSAKVGTI